MKILPQFSNFNNKTVITFKKNENNKPYKFNPEITNSPRRQAIENIYGKKIAELADLASKSEITQREYELRLAALLKNKEKEILSIEKSNSN